MKIVIINGSHRKNGNCEIFSEKAKEILSVKHSVELFNLNDCNIIPCNGCLICEEGNICPLKDDYSDYICPTLKSSDLIIFASPTYFNMPSGEFVNFIDRTNNICDFLSENPKKALVYLVGQTDEESILDAHKCISTYLEIMNIEEITNPIIKVARMPEGVDSDIVDKLKQI